MQGIQCTFDELGLPLATTTFCVVDLETTGGSPARGSRITEIGAVKIQGGEVLGEFQTLVNPHEPIPGFISVLTGITDGMVIDQPPIEAVLPSFLEFAHGCVMVAHNAPFDMGFLRHFAQQMQLPWPTFRVIDTAVLARRVLLKGEVPNVKLATLAARFSSVNPDHRALTDARATVDVLHALFERLGPLGVTTVDELTSFTSKVSTEQRRKRHLAERLPDKPGVYLFRDAHDKVLYVGTSGSVRTRVKSYFTNAEQRTRMAEMIAIATRVDAIVCATTLEAQVRELRLIDAHRPPYNRRSKYPDRVTWIKLTVDPWPRLSLVRKVLDDGADYVGPFNRHSAESALDALHEVFKIRRCTPRLARRPRQSPCVLAELGRCLSPCNGSVSELEYSAEVERVRRALVGDPHEVVDALEHRMASLSQAQRYEDAAIWRDRLLDLLRGTARAQRLQTITSVHELVAAAPHPSGWEVSVIRFGRLASTGILKRGTPSAVWVDALIARAETVLPGPGPAPAALVEESEAILRWLEGPERRMVRGSWSSPLSGAARYSHRYNEQNTTSRQWAAYQRNAS